MSTEAAAAMAPPDDAALLRAALGPASPETAACRLALKRLDWATPLPNEAAPGYFYFAGGCRGVAIGGGGRDPGEAARRLAGEASEVLAQSAAPAPGGQPVDPSLAAVWGGGPSTPAFNVTRGRTVGAPLASIFTCIPAAAGAPPRSLGLAAGRDAEAARLAGLLELVERDAAAAWWSGAARARALEAAQGAGAAADLARLRAGAAGRARPTRLLALPAVAGVTVVCAMSCDPAGRGLALGFKAALAAADAATGAVCELLQMEIALQIARLRRAQGRAAAGDAGPLARAALDPDAHDAFAALSPLAAEAAAPGGFAALASRLGAIGIEVTVADLATPPDGLAVAKVFAPGLRPLPGPGRPPHPGSPGALAALM